MNSFSFVFYATVRGNHTHVKVFAGVHEGARGKCGELTFRNEEWKAFKAKLKGNWYHDHYLQTIEISER